MVFIWIQNYVMKCRFNSLWYNLLNIIEQTLRKKPKNTNISKSTEIIMNYSINSWNYLCKNLKKVLDLLITNGIQKSNIKTQFKHINYHKK